MDCRGEMGEMALRVPLVSLGFQVFPGRRVFLADPGHLERRET
jgi:hypothetical protein